MLFWEAMDPFRNEPFPGKVGHQCVTLFLGRHGQMSPFQRGLDRKPVANPKNNTTRVELSELICSLGLLAELLVGRYFQDHRDWKATITPSMRGSSCKLNP